jgi:uncharacterized protein (TIGR02466 family)
MQMQKMQLHLLFPTPLLETQFREFTLDELVFIQSQEKSDTFGNRRSLESYVLDKPELADVKNGINQFIKVYFEEVVHNTKVEPYITQSWVQFNEKGNHHHTHTHPNSYLSGVLYVNTDSYDAINFESPFKPQIIVYPEGKEPDKETKATATGHYDGFPVCSRKLILFPSYLPHSVSMKQGDALRISIAFNVFVRGQIGKEGGLTELKLA